MKKLKKIIIFVLAVASAAAMINLYFKIENAKHTNDVIKNDKRISSNFYTFLFFATSSDPKDIPQYWPDTSKEFLFDPPRKTIYYDIDSGKYKFDYIGNSAQLDYDMEYFRIIKEILCVDYAMYDKTILKDGNYVINLCDSMERFLISAGKERAVVNLEDYYLMYEFMIIFFNICSNDDYEPEFFKDGIIHREKMHTYAENYEHTIETVRSACLRFNKFIEDEGKEKYEYIIGKYKLEKQNEE